MITAKVAFVLRLLDDFSGKIITGKKFLFTYNGQTVKPVEKAEGLYVFLEPMEEKCSITVYGVDYYEQQAIVEKKELQRSEPICEVRMYGRPGRNFPYRCSLYEGCATGKKLEYPVWVCAKRGNPTGLTFKEVKTEEDGSQVLVVNGYSRENMVGHTYGICIKKDIEIFVITDKIGMNEYRVAGKLSGRFTAKAPIERVYCSVSDEMGNYAIPVDEGEQESITEVIILQHK